jgi:hypothetical protein
VARWAVLKTAIALVIEQKPTDRHSVAHGAEQPDPLIALKLQAKLAEYDKLKAEIANRSDYQHRLLQIHIAALGLIFAAAFANSVSHWILFVIPFEALLLGRWWIDHARTIARIGGFIADHHEEYIDSLLNDTDLISWEREGGTRAQHRAARTFRPYRSTISTTFLYPAALIWLFTLGTIVIEILGHGSFIDLSGLAREMRAFLPLNTNRTDVRLISLSLVLVFESYAIWQFMTYYRMLWPIRGHVGDAVRSANGGA